MGKTSNFYLYLLKSYVQKNAISEYKFPTGDFVPGLVSPIGPIRPPLLPPVFWPLFPFCVLPHTHDSFLSPSHVNDSLSTSTIGWLLPYLRCPDPSVDGLPRLLELSRLLPIQVWIRLGTSYPLEVRRSGHEGSMLCLLCIHCLVLPHGVCHLVAKWYHETMAWHIPFKECLRSHLSSVQPRLRRSLTVYASVDDDAKGDDYEDGEIADGVKGVADEDEDAADASPLSSRTPSLDLPFCKDAKKAIASDALPLRDASCGLAHIWSSRMYNLVWRYLSRQFCHSAGIAINSFRLLFWKSVSPSFIFVEFGCHVFARPTAACSFLAWLLLASGCFFSLRFLHRASFLFLLFLSWK